MWAAVTVSLSDDGAGTVSSAAAYRLPPQGDVPLRRTALGVLDARVSRAVQGRLRLTTAGPRVVRDADAKNRTFVARSWLSTALRRDGAVWRCADVPLLEAESEATLSHGDAIFLARACSQVVLLVNVEQLVCNNLRATAPRFVDRAVGMQFALLYAYLPPRDGTASQAEPCSLPGMDRRRATLRADDSTLAARPPRVSHAMKLLRMQRHSESALGAALMSTWAPTSPRCAAAMLSEAFRSFHGASTRQPSAELASTARSVHAIQQQIMHLRVIPTTTLVNQLLVTLCTSPSSAVVRSVNDTLRVYHGLVQRYPASNTWHFLSWSQVDMFVSAIHALVLTSDAEAMSERCFGSCAAISWVGRVLRHSCESARAAEQASVPSTDRQWRTRHHSSAGTGGGASSVPPIRELPPGDHTNTEFLGIVRRCVHVIRDAGDDVLCLATASGSAPVASARPGRVAVLDAAVNTLRALLWVFPPVRGDAMRARDWQFVKAVIHESVSASRVAVLDAWLRSGHAAW